MKNLLLLFACLLALASPLRTQADPPDIVVVRIQDYGINAKIFITKGEGNTEEVKVDIKGINYEKGTASVNEGYCKVLAKLYQEGYVLQNSSVISTQNGVGTVIYVFVKAK